MSDNNTPTQNQQQAPARNNGPVETLRDGALKVAIFKNEREQSVNFSMEPGRLYTNSEGQVKESKSLSGTEPIRMARLLDKGYDRIGEFKAQMKAQSQSQEKER